MLIQAGAKRKLGLRSAGTIRVLRGAWRAMAEHSLRRGLRIVPLQLAWHYWRRGLCKAAKSVEAQLEDSPDEHKIAAYVPKRKIQVHLS